VKAAPRAGIARLLILGGSRAAAAVLAFGAAALLARSLSPEALGAWAVALAVQGYALHLGELGLRSVATAEAARGPNRVPALLARYLPLRLGVSAAVLAAVAAGAGLLAPTQAPVVILAAAGVLATAAQLDWVALADGRHALAGALLLVRPAAFLALLAAATVAVGTRNGGAVLPRLLVAGGHSLLVGAHRPSAPRAVVGPGRAAMPVASMLRAACRSAPSRSSTTPS
jgi:O-antigen/teichoic acid export membrane protein